MDIYRIKGIGEKTGVKLNKLGIYNTDDIVTYYPRNYDIYEQPLYIRDFDNRAIVSVAGVIVKQLEVKKVKSLQIVTGYIKDGRDDILKVVWFNMPFLRNSLKPGYRVILRGRLSRKKGNIELEQPEILTSEQYVKKMSEMQPLYGLTAGLSNTVVKKAVKYVLDNGMYDNEYLPEEIIKKYNLMSYDEAVNNIHFPENKAKLIDARKRLVFDELFLFINSMKRLKDNSVDISNEYLIDNFDESEELITKLPYELTNAQKNVWEEIKKDLSSGKRLNRLIQGDVGSGKTIISFLALIAASAKGYQGALMAPTEVLAKQHYISLVDMKEKYNLEISPILLTGEMKAKEKREAHEKILSGEADIVIGTHALIQEKVEYRNLSLVITDEQHRFGVKQREALSTKGNNPHIMVMSATPIPRTLAIILYGDLDVSVINELPANRLPIKNCVVGRDYRKKAYKFMLDEIKKGRQVYVICPMVEESDNLEAENVVDYANNLRSIFPDDVTISYLHGKMKSAEKNQIMQDFSDGRTDILVSTTVIEVGVNVPNATVMMVENAERFGLAALHQLRGRVGRGEHQSYCIFLSTSDKEETMERLSILNNSNDGFYIASEDLKLRGAGDFFGIRQSGDMDFKLADIYLDALIIKQASEAIKLINAGEIAIREEEELCMYAKIEKYTKKAMENINL